MKTRIRLISFVAMLLLSLGVMLSCSSQQRHVHSYSSDWSYDDTHHWQAAVCQDTVECLYICYDLSEHDLIDGACTVCEYALDSTDGVGEGDGETNTPDNTPDDGTNDNDDVNDNVGTDDNNGSGEVDGSDTENGGNDNNGNDNDGDDNGNNDTENGGNDTEDGNDDHLCQHQYVCEVISQATCTADGENKFTCSLCQDSYIENVDAYGHSEESIPAIEPTCSQVGLVGGKKCSVCGEITEEQIEINPLGHSYIEGVCTVCNESDPNYIPPDPYSIRTATTDKYCWVDVVSFTAAENGEYTFYLPAGLGAWPIGNRGPVIDSLHANYVPKECSFSVFIAAGSTYEFHIAASVTQDWAIKWSFVPGELPPDLPEVPDIPDELIDITGTYYGTDAFGNQQLNLVIDSAAGTVVFNYHHQLTGPNTINATYIITDGEVSLFGEDGKPLHPLSGTLTLVNNVPAYASYNATEYMLSTDPPGGDGSDSGVGNVDEIKGTMVDEEENTFAVTQQDLANDKMFVKFTPVNSGVYDFISNHLFVDLIFTENGIAAEKNEYDFYILEAYVTYIVQINLEYIAYGGYYTITPDYQYPEGHVKNPIWYTLGENATATYKGDYQTVWYQFYADKTGKLTVTSTTPGVTIMVTAVINFDISGEDTISLDVVKGRKYYIGFAKYDSETSVGIGFSASIEDGEITTDGSVNAPHNITLGNNSVQIGSSNGMYFIYQATVNGVITLSGGNGLSWCVTDFVDQAHTTTEDISIHLFVGDIVYFYVESDDATEIANFTATLTSDPKQVYYGDPLVIDGSVGNEFVIEYNTYAYFRLAGTTGKFIFSWDNPDAIVTVSGTPINNGDTVNITSAWFGPYFELYLENYVSGTVILTITPVS